MNKRLEEKHGITLIAFAISRKCVRYEERAWKPCVYEYGVKLIKKWESRIVILKKL